MIDRHPGGEGGESGESSGDGQQASALDVAAPHAPHVPHADPPQSPVATEPASRRERRAVRRAARRAARRARGHRLPKPTTIAVGDEVFALALSVVANVLAVRHDGPIAIGWALVLPFLLIGGVYLFLRDHVAVAWRVPWPGRRERLATKRRAGRPARARRPGASGWLAWYANLVAAVVLIGPPAVASYYHQRELLLSVHTPGLLATLLPLTVDGLVLRAALTLLRHEQPTTTTVAPVDVATATDVATGGDQPDPDDDSDVDELAETGPDTEPLEQPLPTFRGVAPTTVTAIRDAIRADHTLGRKRIIADYAVTGHVARSLLATYGTGAAPFRVVSRDGEGTAPPGATA